MKYKGRIWVVVIFITIVLLWHSFYFIVDFNGAYYFLIERGHYIWDILFIPLLVPFFWWLGAQYDKSKFLSENDYLTGLVNRRFTKQYFHKAIVVAEKNKKKLGVITIDLNDFKLINDFYGHVAGDKVLKQFSEVILTSVGKNDIAARWGGDEFIIITPNIESETDLINMMKQIEIKAKPIFQLSPTESFLSIGTSIYKEDADNLEDLLKEADKKLYQNKHSFKMETKKPI